MIEFFQECIAYVNLPATGMMIMVLLYWMMVMVGVFGLDTLDLDFDADADLGLDPGLGIDADVGINVDGGVDGAPATTFGGGSSASGNDGFLRSLFDFFYLGEVPIVIIGTFFVLFWWIATYLTNHFWNVDQSLWIAAAWFLPNAVVSLVLTRFSMIPFSIIFREEPAENKTREELCGQIGKVTTSEVTETFGQMELKINDEPEMILNVRAQPGEKLGKGDAAKIISFNHSNGTFLVELTKWEKI